MTDKVKSKNVDMKVAKHVNYAENFPVIVKNVPKLSKETLWHQRLGHTLVDKIMMIDKINIKKENPNLCLACSLAKFTKLPFVKSESRASKIFDLVHIDTWLPYKVHYRGKFKYFITFVDDFSRVTWVRLIKLKFEAFDDIKSFVKMARNQFGQKV